MEEWKPSDGDAFLLATENGLVSYYYAIKADLHGQGRHYYKEDQNGEPIEVNEKEIVDILKKQAEIDHLKENSKDVPDDIIFKRCPCLRMENEHLVPLITRD